MCHFFLDKASLEKYMKFRTRLTAYNVSALCTFGSNSIPSYNQKLNLMQWALFLLKPLPFTLVYKVNTVSQNLCNFTNCLYYMNTK